MKETLFNVNMHCAACKGNIENKLKRTKGIKDVNYDRYGDLYIYIKVITPKKLSREQKSHKQRLRRKRQQQNSRPHSIRNMEKSMWMPC